MAQLTPVINSFNAGEISPLLEGRFDLQKYSSACRTLENFLIQPYGGVTRRPGTKFIAATKYADKVARLLPFEFSTEQAYHLEFGDEYIRFYKDRAQILKSSPAAWLTLTDYEIGDFVTESGTSYYCIEAHTSGTFSTDLAADKWVAQEIYEIPSPYLETDLASIQFVQSADVMFLVHPDYPPKKLSRLDHDDWTLTDFPFQNGPFMDENVSAVTITPSYPAWATTTDYAVNNHVVESSKVYICVTAHTSGVFATDLSAGKWRQVFQYTGNNMTLTASAATFDAGHVNSLMRIRHLRSDAAKEGSLAASAGAESNPFPVSGGWRFTTRGTWTATLELQRSFDNGVTWLTYQVYTSAADFNTNTTGEEVNANVLFKVKRITAGTNAIPWMFNIENTYYDGVVKITAVASTTSATAEVQTPVGELTATDLWSEGAWSEYRGWPACIAFFEQRLFFAATETQPQTVWSSKSAVFTDFKPGTLDDDALSYTIGADRVNEIRWMQPQSQLLLGTIAGEWKLGGSDIGEPVTPTNVSIRRQSTYGSANIQAALVNDVVLFLQRQGRKVREMTIDPQSVQDKYVAPDMTILAEHITGADGVVAIAYQQQPDSILWCVRADGQMASMTYERDQDVVGWSRHITDGYFESISIIPGEDEDEIAVVVKRDIDGSTVRYIEIFAPYDFGSDQADAFFVDSGLSFDGGDAVEVTNATQATEIVITAVAHGFLDGQQVKIVNVEGMTELNGKVYTVSDKTADTFKIKDSTGTSYISALSDLSKLDTLGFWKMNDDAASADVVDTFAGNDGTANVDTETISVAGKINTALEFSGSEAVEIGAVSSLQVDDRSTTWSVWLKFDSPAGGFYFGNADSTPAGWEINIAPQTAFFKNHADNKTIFATASDLCPGGTWNHIAIIRNGLNSKIYVNGQSKSLLFNTDELSDVMAGGADQSVTLNFRSTDTSFFSSTVDALMMFDRALTAEEVATIYNSGNGTEVFGFNAYTGGGTAQRVENTFTNLAHLEGETCQVLADGGVHPQVEVESGTAKLTFFANKVHIGLPYQSNLIPTRLVFGGNDGSTAARRKRIHEVFVRFHRSLNGKMGRDADHLDPIIFGQFSDLMGQPPELFTGDKWVQFNGDIASDSNMLIRADTPTPITVLALMLKIAMIE